LEAVLAEIGLARSGNAALDCFAEALKE